MKKLKKILVFLVLLVGCCCCFASCSCSSKKSTDPTETPSTENSSPGIQEATYYNVSVLVTGNEGAGTVVSSNGSNRHVSGSSPIYTFTPNRGYAIETITIDGVIYFTHLTGGYKTEPEPVTIQNIDKDCSLGVTFKHMQYNVSCSIEGEMYGGTIVSSTGNDSHMGATSPTYTVTPNEGYCILSLKVDGENVYDYMTDFVTDRDGATTPHLLDEPFEVMNGDHSISVVFARLYNLKQMAVEGYYYEDYNKSPEREILDNEGLILKGVSAVTFDGVDNYTQLPLGLSHKIRLELSENMNSYFDEVLVKVSMDGGIKFSEGFNPNEDYEDNNLHFTYDSETKVIQFEEFNENVVIKANGKPKAISLTLYDYDNQTTVSTINTYLFAFKDGIDNSLNWYYSLSTNYYVSNIYIGAEINSINGAGGKIYRIFLDETMLAYDDNDNLLNQIILIYSATDLKK